jgi:cyclin-dependent kinase 8/11
MNYQYKGGVNPGGSNTLGSMSVGGGDLGSMNAAGHNVGHANATRNSMMPQPTLMASSSILTIGPYKHRKDLTREPVLSKYQIIGYIAAGTYGKVYKAKSKRTQPKDDDVEMHALDLPAAQAVKPVLPVLDQKQQQQQLQPQSLLLNAQTMQLLQQQALRQQQQQRQPQQHQSQVLVQYPQLPQQSYQQKGFFSVPQNVSSTAPDTKQPHYMVTGNDGVNDAGFAQNHGRLQHIPDSPTQALEASSFPSEQLFAIKKFKNENHLNSKNYSHDINGNEIVHYTGISQSAIREMSICREISNKNITKTIDILLESKSIYIVLEFCEHDLLQIIHFHSHPEVRPILERTVKSLIWQILNGVLFLHKNWIFHRDLKPANIMVTSGGVVKIGDLGLARKFNNPLQSLYTGDKVVVTIWYRAPELLLGTRNYTPAIDLWAVGCILAELLSLRPIFKGEEAKMDMNNKKLVPFQTNQFQKIIEILGSPTVEQWPSLRNYPEYAAFKQDFPNPYEPKLSAWFKAVGGKSRSNLELLHGLLEYDPIRRLTAENALVHPHFLEQPRVSENAFEGLNFKYPKRRIFTDDNDIISGVHGGKRHGSEDPKMRKRPR